MFTLSGKLLAINLDNKEIVLNLLDLIITIAHSEEHMKILRGWLESGPYVLNKDGNKVEIKNSLLNQDNRFIIIAFIFRSRVISLEEKNKLLEAEIEKDKNSDRSVRARCKCRAALPDKEIKAELWNKFVNDFDSESLYNMKSYMAYFASIDQLDLVEDFVTNKFFEDAMKVSKKEFFYVDAFVSSCGPILCVTQENINKLEELAEKSKEFDNLRRKSLELADDMRRFLTAQNLAQEYLNTHKN
jgi:hypothetical protein